MRIKLGWHLSEAMEADGKLDVGNWAVQLLHRRPWWGKSSFHFHHHWLADDCQYRWTEQYFHFKDINECLKDNGGCDQEAQCINHDGGFRCDIIADIFIFIFYWIQ